MSNRRAQDERIEGTPDGANAITEIIDVPDAPTIGTATAGTLSASVTFTAATTGGTPSLYTATSTPGSITGTSATSPITVSGLAAGTSYTFKVKGSNSTGTGAESSASNSVTPAQPVEGAYDAIGSVVVPSGGLSSVTFAGIPAGYANLQIRYIARATWQYGDSLVVRFNDDTTSGNYPYTHYLAGNGTSASNSYDNASPQPQIGYLMPGAGSYSTTNMFACGVIDVFDYASTNKNKVMKNIYGSDNNYTGSAALPVALGSTVWLNTSAITKITITAANSNLAQYSSFAIYGVR